MATSEALVKYYDCLKDSFNKIQDKDNEVALINAALRPKIREEFAKSSDVLNSYLDYIEVFCVIYNEKFNNVCSNVICPLFKEHEIVRSSQDGSASTTAMKLHQTLQSILSTKSSLAEEFAYCVTKSFPFLDKPAESKEFFTYLRNCLHICNYVDSDPMCSIIVRILDRMNPPKSSMTPETVDTIQANISKAYEVLYDHVTNLSTTIRSRFIESLLKIIVRDLLCGLPDNLCHLIIYVCSLDKIYAEKLVALLWSTFIDTAKPLEERKVSVGLASFFLARANYMNLEDLMNYLETSCNWCHEFLEDHADVNIYSGTSERVEGFYAAAQSIIYLITQRYREMYEEDTINILNKMRLDKIIRNHLRPLEHCERHIENRFREVANLYHVFDLQEADLLPVKKRRHSTDPVRSELRFFLIKDDSIPEKVRPLYRSYYEPKNFTVYRE